MTKDFLDIGVVRIQSWLTRTPKLQGRRGASTLISRAGDPNEITGILGDLPARINHEAGRIDGVVALELLDTSRATQVERTVVGHLRRQLPGVSLAVKHYRGETYDEARADGPKHEREWPAPVFDWPAGRPCQWCGMWPATPNDQDSEQNRLCRECVQRREIAGAATNPRKPPYAEVELLQRLGARLEIPDQLDHLAQLDIGNEVALVYADGNGIGAFIRHVFDAGKPDDFELAKTIDDATWHALVTAVTAIHDADAQLPVIPHLVGGDDVLVSVPARRAWVFTDTLLAEFTGRIGDATRNLGVRSLPTLSAGVVFHHWKVPLFLVNERAKELLRRAKVHTSGRAAALAWQDVTHDGREPVRRPALRHDVLRTCWDALTGLAAQPASAKYRLSELARAHGENSDELTAHAHRLGIDDVLVPFREGPISLTDALGMVRWWWR